MATEAPKTEITPKVTTGTLDESIGEYYQAKAEQPMRLDTFLSSSIDFQGKDTMRLDEWMGKERPNPNDPTLYGQEPPALIGEAGALDVVASHFLQASPMGIAQRITENKPFLSQEEIALAEKHPVAAFLGSAGGSVSTYTLATLIPQVSLPVAFGATGALMKTAEIQAQPELNLKVGSNMGRIALYGVGSYIMGMIFSQAQAGETILQRLLWRSSGAGATAITNSVIDQGIASEGKEIDAGKAALEGLFMAVVIGTISAITEIPELRGLIVKEAESLTGKKLSLNEAKAVVKSAGIKPESLSPEFQKAQYEVKRAAVLENIKKKASDLGYPPDIIEQVIRERGIAQRDNLLTDYLTYLTKTNPERAAKLMPFFNAIKNGADPVDILIAQELMQSLKPPKVQIEQSIGEAGAQPKAGGMIHIPEVVEPFYSKMRMVLAQKMPESAPVSQVRGILASAQIPKEEIEWSGIEDFLRGKEKIDKTELLEYLQKNQLTIEENIRGEDKKTKDIKQHPSVKELEESGWQVMTNEEDPEFTMLGFKDPETGDILTAKDIEKFAKQENNVQLLEIANLAKEAEKAYARPEYTIRTKFSDTKYNVVTENYKELLLSVPQAVSYIKPEQVTIKDITSQRPTQALQLRQKGRDVEILVDGERYTDVTNTLLTDDEIIKNFLYQQNEGIRKEAEVSGYLEPHFEKRGVFAHARVADVTDEQGRKGLFANEVQSQWALEGRKEGFIKEPSEEHIQEVMKLHQMSREEAIDAIKRTGNVPYHPVVSRWHEVILKRLLRYAAENGYDFLAWATGEQVAEYYNLAKYVDEIQYQTFKDGTYAVDIVKDGKVLDSWGSLTKDKLERHIGKDVANQIIQGVGKKIPKRDMKSISGEGLKVGGEWARNLYDRQIPNWLNDYAKKFGAQVESVKIFPQGKPHVDTGIETRLTQQSITITPEMKQALLGEGQPVFGKMPKEIGVPGAEPAPMQIFRMDESVKIVNTKGEIVTLPKGEEYRVLSVYDADGNVVENKVKLVDGKQVTVFEGELRKLKGKLLGPGEAPMAGGMVRKKGEPEYEPGKGTFKEQVDKSREKLLAEAGAKPPAKPPETAVAGGPEGEEPKGNEKDIKERKADMELWNSPEITVKLFFSEKEFVKKYIDEGKTLKQIAKELGESIEDVKKTEIYVHDHMNEIADDIQEAMTAEGRKDTLEDRKRLKEYLRGYLDPALKTEEEYHDLTFLPWIWAEEGKGVRPDDMYGEISEMGFPVENEEEVRDLIKEVFKQEIAEKAGKTKPKATQKGLGLAKPKKVPEIKPERAITGIGRGSVISTRQDIDGSEKSRISKEMPFGLLGNKAEIVARLTKKFKGALRFGIKKVYDLFGGAKGYRVGLFPDIPSEDYNLNEGTPERANYYKNVQDPEKQQIIVSEVNRLRNELMMEICRAFDIDPTKYTSEVLRLSINKWMQRGKINERYEFAREVIQKFGDKILQEVSADKFKSPESSAKYYFLQNSGVYSGISKTEKGYKWSQGILKEKSSRAEISDTMRRLEKVGDITYSELMRDADMPITQGDAWERMDELVQDLNAGTINPEETVVLVDPQYLNPSEKEGTYTVGREDATWEGHKQNLEDHLLPLIKTGVKIIYTNNEDKDLTKWLKENKIPFNVNQEVGQKGGRDEIISFINYKLPREYTIAGRADTGQYEPGEITGESKDFSEFLARKEAEIKAGKQKVPSYGKEWTAAQRKEIYIIALRKKLVYEDKEKKTHDRLHGFIKMYPDKPYEEIKDYMERLPDNPIHPPKLPHTKQVIEASFYEKKIGEPGISQLIFEPWYMFKRMKIWDEIGKPIYDAQDQFEQRVQEKIYLLKQWLKVAGRGKEVSRRIWEYADGTINFEDFAKMSNDEKYVAESWKLMAEEYADKLGISTEERKPNYISHIIEELFREYLRDTKYPFPQELANLMSQDFYKTKEIANQFLKTRLGFPIVRKDFWMSALSYIKAAEKKLAFDPVLKQVNAYLSKGLLPASTAKYVKNVIDNQVLMRPTISDRVLKVTFQHISDWVGSKKIKLSPEISEQLGGLKEIEVPLIRVSSRPGTKVVGLIRNASYLSLIAGNIRTMLVNLTQTVGTVAKLKGWPHQVALDMAYGHLKSLQYIFTPHGWELMRKSGVMDVDINTFIEGTTPQFKIYGNWIKDILYLNMKFSEFQNRVSSAFAGAKNKVRSGDTEGLARLYPEVGKEAILLDKELSDMINFRYGSLFRPTFTMDPIGQAIYHLNSFNFKQLQLMHQLYTEMDVGRWGKNWQRDVTKDPIKFLKSLATDNRGAFLRWWLYASLLTVMLGIGLGKSGILGMWIGESPIYKLIAHLVTGNFKELKYDLQSLIPLRGAIRRIQRIGQEGPAGILKTGKVSKNRPRKF